MTKIQGVKIWRYTAWGVVPPGVPENMIDAAVHSGVAWAGNLLPHLRQASVTVEEVKPEDMPNASGLVLPFRTQ